MTDSEASELVSSLDLKNPEIPYYLLTKKWNDMTQKEKDFLMNYGLEPKT